MLNFLTIVMIIVTVNLHTYYMHRQDKRIMATQSDLDALTARLTALDTTVTRVATDFGALKTQVAALEAAAAAGNALDFTAANATIDSLTAHLDAVDPIVPVA